MAFQRRVQGEWNDTVVSWATWSEIVHSEIVVRDAAGLRSFSAYDKPPPAFVERVDRSVFARESLHWVFVKIPIDPAKKQVVYDFIHSLIAANLRYATGWECVLPETLVDRFQDDLHPLTPASQWKTRGVFCSQVGLLFLKHLQLRNCLRRDLSPCLPHNSFHCSPGFLYHFLTRDLGLPKVTPTAA